ncbi:MAG: hypothetical protein ABGZ23_00145 [Fuerstiella sp.]
MECFSGPYQRNLFDFRTASERFQWIEDTSETVFVPFNTDAEQLINQLRQLQNDTPLVHRLRKVLRQLQRYSISVFPNIFRAMAGHDIEVFDSGHAVLINPSCYDKQPGFRPDLPGFPELHTLIV